MAIVDSLKPGQIAVRSDYNFITSMKKVSVNQPDPTNNDYELIFTFSFTAALENKTTSTVKVTDGKDYAVFDVGDLVKFPTTPSPVVQAIFVDQTGVGELALVNSFKNIFTVADKVNHIGFRTEPKKEVSD
jgi:hypothetical protein